MTRTYNRHDPAASDKLCAACGTTKAKAEFGPDRRHPDGLKSRCRACCLAAYHANREAEIVRMRDYYASNRAAMRARNAAYLRAHPDETRARKAKRRARARGAHVEHVNRLVVLERGDGVCGICGGDVDPLRFDVDHIVPLARGGEHSYANTQPAHPSCNSRKRDRLPEEPRR